MNKFGFIIHPLAIQDVTKKYKIAEKVPPKIVARLIKRRPPFVMSEITGVTSKDGTEISGYFIAVPLLPWQILELDEDYVIKKIAKGCKVAKKNGARIVGLGAFTALVGDGGRKIAERSEIAVTTGNTYTIATAIQGTLKAASMMDIDCPASTLAVVGATGSIGRVCSQILSKNFRETIIVGRDIRRLEKIRNEIKEKNDSNVKISSDVKSSIKNADVVLTVTSAADVIIEPEDIKPGAVICDVARPRDVSPRVAEARNDVLVIDGGIVKIPGKVNFNLDFGMPPGYAEACMAETMILALEDKIENYTLGKDISIEKVLEIEGLADKHGFELAGFRRFEKPVTDKEITSIKENAEARKSGI